MPKFKVLKSVAHNLAHSYLSLMNYIDDEYTVERIFQIAKIERLEEIKIDVLKEVIEPPPFATKQIMLSLTYLKKNLISLLESEHMTLEHIESCSITIRFDLNNIKKSDKVPDLELPTYSCLSEIVDINGKHHSASVVEWWRY